MRGLVAPVDVEPEVTPDMWSLVRHTSGTVHIVSSRKGREIARFSSPVASFDPDSMTATTVSGRVYVLTGQRNDEFASNLMWHPQFVELEDLALQLADAGSALRH